MKLEIAQQPDGSAHLGITAAHNESEVVRFSARCSAPWMRTPGNRDALELADPVG